MKTIPLARFFTCFLCLALLMPMLVCYPAAVGEPEEQPILTAENKVIAEGGGFDLSADPAATAVRTLTEGTLIIRYQSTSSQPYQSLFSVSNATAGNEDRHFHLYVTPGGTLGMELRNTDGEFKYTMAAASAVNAGQENIVAFSADSATGTYKLFANGELVATLNKSDFRFFDDITGLDTVTLGGTVRGGQMKYPFGGTIGKAEVYDAVLDDQTLIAATENGSGGGDVSFTKDNVSVSAGSVVDLTSEASGVLGMTEGTILVRYTSTSSNAYQSLFSVSNSTSGNQDRHFHLYVTPGGVLGFELRNTDAVMKYTGSRASAVRVSYLEEPAVNTVAFRADAGAGTYTLFANGQKLTTVSVNDFKFFTDITGANTVSLGGTLRNGAVSYPFGGTIAHFEITSTVLSDEELIAATDDTTYGSLIFSDSDTTLSNYFRIPSLLTLESGTVVAAADARYGGTHDSKSNIDTAFSRSTDGGVTWSDPILPLCFDDYAAQRVDWPTEVGLRDLQIQGSASFIDPVMVQDAESGRLFLFADVMPAGIGSSNASVGNGYKTIDGQQYLKLRWHEDGSNAYNYSVRENGVIYNDTTNQPTEYTMNADFELLKNGTPLTVKQYSVSFSGSQLLETPTDVDVAMNVFYKDSYFKVFPTAYLGMTYSDDGGNTWNYAAADNFSSGATAEAQIVEMPNGMLIAYVRTSSGYIAERRSVDGGVTWTAGTPVSGVSTTSYGTQMSVLRYSGLVDGKPAIIMSTPNSTSGRNTGVLRVGLITDTGAEGVDRYTIDWAYTYTVDGSVGYSYSCLAELPDGKIGLLYEKYDSWSRDQLHMKNVLPFETYTISQLVGE